MADFTMKAMSPYFGAEICGLDLSGSLSSKTVSHIYEALVKFGVLIFREQRLSPEQQCQFGRNFGEPVVALNVYNSSESVPEVTVLHSDEASPPDTDIWHVDSSFREEPPFATVLSSVDVPSLGGDTIFVCMRKVLEALPIEIRAMISDRFAVHEPGDLKNFFAQSPGDRISLIKGLAEHGAAIHPMVQCHPYSQEPALYINETYTSHILGLNAGDSRRLLSFLFDCVKSPEYQYRHRWEDGMVVMWDNRLVQHYAVADYLPESRTMHRLTLQTDFHVNTKDRDIF